MKMIILRSTLIAASLLLGNPQLINAQEVVKEGFSYICICKAKDKCEALENMYLTYTGTDLNVNVSNTDGEFNASFDAALSNKAVPEEFADTHLRYTITSNRKYLPGIYEKGDLLVKSNMVNGGTRINGIKKVTYTGSVVVIDQKGSEKMLFGCQRD